MSKSPSMSRTNRWLLPTLAEDFRRILEAAKEDGPQLVADEEGVFTVTYERRRPVGSAREFLTRGGPDDE